MRIASLKFVREGYHGLLLQMFLVSCIFCRIVMVVRDQAYIESGRGGMHHSRRINDRHLAVGAARVL